LLWLKLPGEQGCFRERKNTLGELTVAVFLQNILQFHQQRYVILHVEILALWKIINEEDAQCLAMNL